MLLIQAAEQILRIFPFGMSVSRTGAFADRQIVLMLKADYIRLIHIHQGTDHCQIHPIQVGNRRKGMKTPLKDEREEHSLHYIIFVMGIGHLIAAGFFDGLI